MGEQQMDYDSYYDTYYEAHYIGENQEVCSSKRYRTENEVRQYAKKLIKHHRHVWITQTDPIDIWETDDDLDKR